MPPTPTPTPTLSIRLPHLPFAPSCTLCPLHAYTNPRGIGTTHVPTSLPAPTPPTPAPHPAVILIGQNPGHDELRANLPFVGYSGAKIHRAYIPGVHLHTLASCYLTNVARCATPNNALPPPSHTRTCSTSHLLPELRLLATLHPPPLYLLLLGAPATSAIYRLLTRTRDVSLSAAFSTQGLPAFLPQEGTKRDPVEEEGRHRVLLFSTYHPAYIGRNPNLRFAVRDHLQLLQDHLVGHAPTPSKPLIVPPFPPQEGAWGETAKQ